MGMKVFYAWQSDRREKVCHYLIRDATQAAIDELKASAEIEEAPVLDHDTKDVPGTPHISETIRQKIKCCAAFVADLTYSTAYQTADKRAKQTPNPNVMVELGMAFESVGQDRIVLVMNTEFGMPEDLPFDLKHHRHPLQYKLAEGADKATRDKVQKELAGKLKGALSLILKAMIDTEAEKKAKLEQSERQSRQAQADETWKNFVGRARMGGFHGFSTGDVSYLTFAVIPLAHSGPVDLELVRDVFNDLPIMRGASDGKTRADHAYTFHHFPNEQGGRVIDAVVALYDTGVILSAQRMEILNLPDKPGISVNYVGCERKLVEQVARYVQVLRRLSVHGPLQFRLALHQVNDCNLIVGRKAMLHGGFDPCDRHEVTPRPVEIPAAVAGQDVQQVATAIKPVFDWVWKSVGAPRCLYFNDKGEYDLQSA